VLMTVSIRLFKGSADRIGIYLMLSLNCRKYLSTRTLIGRLMLTLNFPAHGKSRTHRRDSGRRNHRY
jgi:hypothetical protein